MNAIRVQRTGGSDVLQLEEMPDPLPGPGEAVVKLEAIGVSYIEVPAHGAVPARRPVRTGTRGRRDGDRDWRGRHAREGR